MGEYQCIQKLTQIISQCQLHDNEQPPDYDNLLQWGAALMELSVYEKTAVAARQRLQAAIDTLNQAMNIENGHHQNHWLLGCAHAMRLEIPLEGDDDLRQLDEEQSVLNFRQAENLDPNNELYVQSNKKAVQGFFKNKFMLGAIGASVVACICKLAFDFARRNKKKE